MSFSLSSEWVYNKKMTSIESGFTDDSHTDFPGHIFDDSFFFTELSPAENFLVIEESVKFNTFTLEWDDVMFASSYVIEIKWVQRCFYENNVQL